jgi:hypothetical protein
MLAIARADVRRFRAVARRAFPNARPRGPAPPVTITGTGRAVALACHLGEVVVALRCTAPQPGKGTVTVTLADLDAVEGAGGVVTLEPAGPDAVTARWDAGPAPRTARLTAFESHRTWPGEPDNLVALPPAFPAALHEVGRSAARDEGKYAVTRVQVRGSTGELCGTDGKQALAWGGFTFPFPEDVLVPAVPLFGARELVGEAAVSIGLDKDWLYLVIGPWQVWLAVDRQGRFPDVHAAAPRACPTRVTLDDRDAADLLGALAGLPGRGEEGGPVTLDLGAGAAVRGRDDRTGDTAEVRLARSEVVNRDHLGRALALGFRDLRVSTPERPVAFRDADRLFLCAGLDPGLAVPPADDPNPAVAERAEAVVPSPPDPVHPDRRIPVPARDNPPPDRNGHPALPAGEPFDPVAEAEALRADLADAHARAHRLVAALKQFKKERRALTTAWSSLKQLNLGP